MGFIFRQTVPRAPSIVRWRAPSPSWFKLNTDGSSHGNPGLAGVVGIIRDSAGHVHLAYQIALGTGTSVLAELTAVWRGLELALTHGLAPLVVEVDVTTVISLLQSCASGKWEVHHLIMRITGSPSPSPGVMMVSRLGPGVFGGGFVTGFGIMRTTRGDDGVRQTPA
ncbi:putative ribonuclease H protein [Sesamum angolense]|uniref:Ribonuclease H protein n=1 Tax=Sesamum angolense TaxID=2727404 RepID=A0AAE1X1A8_9LAMI|nr:putative ribonuclease H protein [Sesamum angolense]